ncbi:putative cytochrome P450 hydroxylase [Cystobacter fuscus DSM 2262]|uniref:Cytochrome P450 hydroxylase n=1 Tax=Cystobacter fuscus (strain ATCC 25194 / DSM 2262 / NBRC 100088 / M29) TaxID=1242864 RepID=S9NY88_CYSF2|nr:cytochrome P450 [Cystobacter fuscus]EPX54982.1 putative cytochrome P450 hydroxylase [Cystobacter fuscus DSM 2262]
MQAALITNPRFLVEPFAELERLRAAGPLHHIEEPTGLRFWLVTRFAEASQLLKDRRIVVHRPGGQRISAVTLSPDVDRMIGRSMLASDPPDHSRLRSLVSKAFTPRFVEELRPRIQRLVDELIDAAEPRGRMDLINDFAFTLPIVVIADMMGLPAQDRHRVRLWSEAITESMSTQYEENPARDAKARDFVDYMRALIDEKRRSPGEDLVSKLTQAEEGGSRLDEHEFLSMIGLLIFAGHETTANLIGNGMLALLTQPEALARLQREPALIPSAIEEFLRMFGPVTVAPRFAAEDIAVAGETIRQGDMVIISLASADRDERQFSHAQTLDVTRESARHLAFGQGIHFCLGAQLARIEADVAFTTLLRRLPGLRLDAPLEAVQWRANMILRGLQRLPVAF